MRSAIERLIRPRSIAIVGASPEPGSMGGNVLGNIVRAGFAGPLHLVSRSRSEIGGRPCVGSIDELPRGIDCVVLVVPAAGIKAAIEACVRIGTGGAVVFAAGFGEAGEAGRQEQAQIAEIARAGGLAMLGPNCIGLTNAVDGLPLTFEPVETRRISGAGVCAITQSGGMAGNVRMALAAKGVPVAYAISTGNEAALDATDLVGALVEAPEVAVFALFVEQIGAPQRFLAHARRARELGKPIVLMHSGRSAVAREAAKSHTGALAGDWAVMRAAVEQDAVVLVETPDELFDSAAILSHFPTPPAGLAAVTTNSGAVRGFLLDLAESIGLGFARLGADTQARLKEIVPGFATVDNPLDLTAQTMTKPQMFGDSAAAMLTDPAVGSVLVAAMPGGPKQQVAKWEAVKPVLSATEKPVALVFMGDEAPLAPDMLAEIAAARVPFFRSPERALRALGCVTRYARDRAAAAREIGQKAAVSLDGLVGTGPVAEHRSKAALRAVGIATPEGALARTVEDAKSVAARIGYPVALKAQADALAHKTDAGGVALGIADATGLEAVWQQVTASVVKAQSGLALDGMLVERMAPKGGVELIVGARRDPQWGAVLMVGAGGVLTELYADVALIPANASAERIGRAIRSLKVARLLDGYRGKPACDEAAVVEILSALGRIMRGNPAITEVEINPLLVLPAGQGALALDALIVLGPQKSR